MRDILRCGIALAATILAVDAARCAPAQRAGAPEPAARLFPWVVAPGDQAGLCATLLDPGQFGRAATGVLVFLDYGSGPTPIPAANAADLAARLASTRSGTPEVRALAASPNRVTLEARDVGGTDGGAVRCTYDLVGGAWRMVALAIVTPPASAPPSTGARR